MPITLSIGRRYNLANSAKVSPSTPGPRLFEAAGCGAPQVACDTGHEIGCYYEPDSEILLARNIDEAVTYLNKASKDHEMLKIISQNAWKRTQAQHLYRHRAKQILQWIREE